MDRRVHVWSAVLQGYKQFRMALSANADVQSIVRHPVSPHVLDSPYWRGAYDWVNGLFVEQPLQSGNGLLTVILVLEKLVVTPGAFQYREILVLRAQWWQWLPQQAVRLRVLRVQCSARLWEPENAYK